MQQDPLAMPVGALMRPAAHVAPEDSLALAAARIHESGVGLVAVLDGHVVIGQLDEEAYRCAVLEGADHDGPSGPHAKSPTLVRPYETGARALRQMETSGVSTLLVADESNRLMGVLTPTDLAPRRRMMLRPPAVGGMATPFGVYLTTGTVHAGAPWYGLVATGMLLFLLLLGADYAGIAIANQLLGSSAPDWLQGLVGTGLPVALFFLGMRLLPLSGTHAAEHQVVHAIERGEELVPQIVRRMPRVHPRCGTNLAVGLSIFLGLAGSSLIANQELRLLLALVVAVAVWRPLGSVLQYYVTTRPANDRQIASGIRAGTELLERYQSSRVAYATIPKRIWNSGMLQVITGSLLMYGIVALVAYLAGWPIAV